MVPPGVWTSSDPSNNNRRDADGVAGPSFPQTAAPFLEVAADDFLRLPLGLEGVPLPGPALPLLGASRPSRTWWPAGVERMAAVAVVGLRGVRRESSSSSSSSMPSSLLWLLLRVLAGSRERTPVFFFAEVIFVVLFVAVDVVDDAVARWTSLIRRARRTGVFTGVRGFCEGGCTSGAGASPWPADGDGWSLDIGSVRVGDGTLAGWDEVTWLSSVGKGGSESSISGVLSDALGLRGV